MLDKRLGDRARAVLARLRQGLAAGTWPVGSTLPREVDLAAAWGVSRPTLHQAVEVLVGEGRLLSRRRGGNQVLPGALAPGPIGIMDPDDPGLVAAAQVRASAAGRQMPVYRHADHAWGPSAEHAWFDRLIDLGASALIAVGTPKGHGDRSAFARLAGAGVRVVHIEPYDLDTPDQEWCLPDYHAAGARMVERLRGVGCRSFAWMDFGDAPFVRLARSGFMAAAQGEVPTHRPNYGSEETDHPDHRRLELWLERLPAGTGVGISDALLAAYFGPVLAAARDLPCATLIFHPGEPAGPCRLVQEVPRSACLERALEHLLDPQPTQLRQWLPCVDAQPG
jgi:hypothetical protein